MPSLIVLAPSRMSRSAIPARRRQGGAATVIVVMILFFVITLAAAYASRNLIFEQRTSANQYKSTSAQEAAEAGIEWAVTMLNSGRIDEECRPTTDDTKNTFRQRYIQYEASGKVTAKLLALPEVLWAACVFNGTTWDCRCPDPDDAAHALPDPLPDGIAAFGVKFSSQISNRPGAVRIDVNGCSSNSRECVTGLQPNTFPGQCQGTACAILAQFPSLRLPPIAAVTVGQTVDGTRLAVVNADVPAGGITVHSGGAINVTPAANLSLGSAPGMPPSLSTRTDQGKLQDLDTYSDDCDRCLFSSVFGLRPATYREQQGVVRVDCGTTGCTSTAAGTPLGKAISAARGASLAWDAASASYLPHGSVLWLSGSGGLQLSSSADVIGSLDAPMTVIVEGTIRVNGPARIFGLVYAANAAIDDGNAAVGTIQGALVSAGTVSGDGAVGTHGRVTYNADILDKLKKYSGTFVRVPGSWRDFP